MAGDRLERNDIENAILRGKVDKKMTRDVGGLGIESPVRRKMAAWFTLCVDSKRWAAL